MTYHCHRCGADNPIVNYCRCDPDNLPTAVPGFEDEYGTEDRHAAQQEQAIEDEIHRTEQAIEDGQARWSETGSTRQ